MLGAKAELNFGARKLILHRTAALEGMHMPALLTSGIAHGCWIGHGPLPPKVSCWLRKIL